MFYKLHPEFENLRPYIEFDKHIARFFVYKKYRYFISASLGSYGEMIYTYMCVGDRYGITTFELVSDDKPYERFYAAWRGHPRLRPVTVVIDLYA